MVVGIGMIAGAMAMGAVWEKHQQITVTDAVSVTISPAMTDTLSLTRGTAQNYTITVRNLETYSANFTLTAVSSNTTIVDAIVDVPTHLIASGMTADYIVTITASDTPGTAEIVYKITES
jgi:spore coat protein U-like protein